MRPPFSPPTLRLFLLLISFAFSACQRPPSLSIAIASNLLPAFEELESLYEKEMAEPIELIPASSGSLSAQVRNGAPFDLFISANEAYPKRLFEEGFGRQAPEVLMWGQLSIWTREPIRGKEIKSYLSSEQVKRIALPEPSLAPFGAVAQDWLQENQLWELLQPKLVFGQNVGHTNQIIRSGSVEAAFSSASASHLPALNAQGVWHRSIHFQEVPHSLLILSSKPAVSPFMRFLRTEIALQVFRDFGYRPQGEGARSAAIGQGGR